MTRLLRPLGLAVLVAAFLSQPALLRAEGERTGEFDYFVLALSWSPSWCALEGDERQSEQCDPRRDLGFTLHGLWPQHEDGWPSFCRTTARDPSRNETAAMADIMGTGGLAWYQWKKHGRCSGLAASAYFDTARRAYDAVVMPDVFERLHREVRLPASVVEEAFLEANPGLSANGITVICEAGRIQEVRLCLTKELRPRDCGADVLRDCRLQDAMMPAVR
jgi:ribonuclease T2